MNTTENILDEIAAAEAEWDTSPSAPAEVAFNTDNTDASDIIAMDEDNEDRSVNGNECHSDQVALVGRDGTEVWCSRARVFEQSGKLSEMISDQQDSEARIHLPVSSSEAILLARGIDADISGWESYTLEELVRARQPLLQLRPPTMARWLGVRHSRLSPPTGGRHVRQAPGSTLRRQTRIHCKPG
ncbi:hypothetical protein L1887_57177 [Cichorium endivia]|nr:hypothetical protein L1887_57177 [Cichorium endivia]